MRSSKKLAVTPQTSAKQDATMQASSKAATAGEAAKASSSSAAGGAEAEPATAQVKDNGDCSCDETLVAGKRVPPPPFHSCDYVRALNHVREREKAEIALFISLEAPTPAMVKDAASAGLYTSVNGKIKVPRVQLLTIAELLDGTKRAQHPDYDPGMSFKKAEAEEHGEQPGLI
jgi:hypothetical protein